MEEINYDCIVFQNGNISICSFKNECQNLIAVKSFWPEN